MITAIDMIGTSLGSGTKTYNLNFCEYLHRQNIKEKILIFITKDYLEEIKLPYHNNIKFIVKPFFLKNIFLRMVWMHLFLPFELKKHRVNQLFSPMNMSPLILKLFKIKLTLALHSNLPWVYFNMMPGNFIRNIFTKYLMQLSIYLCDKLIVNSEFAKNEILEIINLKQKKVYVVYLGIDKKYLLSNDNLKFIKNFDYNNYIISVLSCVKYHNIINLLKAFKLYKDETKSKIKLIFVMQILDKDYFKEINLFITQNSLNNDIIFFHNLDSDFLVNLYKRAKLYVFTSYCEVFGLTSLEAMSQGCPVLISNKSALPEVNGQAAHYFDPDDIQKIYESMKMILQDNDYKEKLVTEGDIHFRKFNWNTTVKQTLEVLNT